MNSFEVTMKIDSPLTEQELSKWIENTVPWEWNLFSYDVAEVEFF